MTFKFRAVLGLAVVSILSGCQTAGSNLPTFAAQKYRNVYLNQDHYRSFAVARGEDGGFASAWSWSYPTVEEAINGSKKNCDKTRQKYNISRPCFAYAIGDLRIEGMSPEKRNKAIQFYTQNRSATNETFEAFLKTGVTHATSNEYSNDVDKAYALSGKWSGVSDNISGSFISSSTSNRGRLKVQLDNVGKTNTFCSGQWLWAKEKYNTSSLPEGTWSLACDNGLTAGGTYISSSPRNGTIEGEDAEGRKISMYFSPEPVVTGNKAKENSIEERLTKLKQFVDDGLVTEKEAEEKRRQILDGL